MGRGQTQDLLLESGICFQRWQVAAVRSRCNSVPCLRQVHCGEPSVAFKVTAAGTEFEQIISLEPFNCFMFHLLQECEIYFFEKDTQNLMCLI